MVGHVDLQRSCKNIRQHVLDPLNHLEHILPVSRYCCTLGAILTSHDDPLGKEGSDHLAPQSNGRHTTVERLLRRDVPTIVRGYDGCIH